MVSILLCQCDGTSVKVNIKSFKENSDVPETVALEVFSEASGESHILHALVEAIAKGQALQAAGQSHILHAPNKVQALQATRPSHILHALVEATAKLQDL